MFPSLDINNLATSYLNYHKPAKLPVEKIIKLKGVPNSKGQHYPSLGIGCTIIAIVTAYLFRKEKLDSC